MVAFEARFHPLLVIVSWGNLDESGFRAYASHFRELRARRERVVVLSDPRAQELPSAHWRRRFAQLADEVTSSAPGTIQASTAVLTSSVLVGAARAVFWLRRTNHETHYTQSAVDGLRWLDGRAGESGLRIPTGAAAHVAALDDCFRRGVLPAIAQEPPPKSAKA